ncbi:MAG TPA: formyltetrahydrofolate deformylase [Chthoniobacteraceae bacterium]|nr:formyltetrahydrofolate deformylase [Chthoniobacteraceae bacterium]
MPTALLKLSCPDRVGLLALLSGFVAEHRGNLVEVHQFTDPESRWFFTRMAIDIATLSCDLPALRADFARVAAELRAEWTIRSAESRMKVVLMVSRRGHCLADLLWRWRSGELAFDIPCVISNHEEFRTMVEREGIVFRHLPVHGEDKEAAFADLANLLEEVQPDLIVLARYMQILPEEVCQRYPGKILNIHHSFLPSFSGANAYQRAYERGVKLIGATCHYATAELDAGPIVDQEVIRVEHFHTANDLVRLGRDCERLALARSVRWHLNDRVLIHGARAIVFRD